MKTKHEQIVDLLRRRCEANGLTLREFHDAGRFHDEHGGQLDGELLDWWKVFGDDLAEWDL